MCVCVCVCVCVHMRVCVYCSIHNVCFVGAQILATVIATWTVGWCMAAAVMLVVKVAVAQVGCLCITATYTGGAFYNLYCIVVVAVAVDACGCYKILQGQSTASTF